LIYLLDTDHISLMDRGGPEGRNIQIGTMDLKIAAITLTNDATLLSRNLADFGKIPGLRVEDWSR
jgi:predicted nucleic acid-binding protein